MSRIKWKILKEVVTKNPVSIVKEYLSLSDIVVDILACYGFDLCNYTPVVVVSLDAGNDITAGTDGGAFFQETLTSLTYDDATNSLDYVDENSNVNNIVLECVSSDANNDITVGSDNKAFFQETEIMLDGTSNPALTIPASHTLKLDLDATNSFPNASGFTTKLITSLEIALQPIQMYTLSNINIAGIYSTLPFFCNLNAYHPLVWVEDQAALGTLNFTDTLVTLSHNSKDINVTGLPGAGTYNFYIHYKKLP
jgi:hypothetical protein